MKKKNFAQIFNTFRTLESPIGGPLGPLGVPKARYLSVLLLLHWWAGDAFQDYRAEKKKNDLISMLLIVPA